MSTFLEVLDQYRGDDASDFDILAPITPVYEFDFASGAVRMWPGQGVLVTSDDREWFGTVGSDGVDQLQAAAPMDIRDGTSARFEFALPYLDQQTYNAIRSVDGEEVAGRDITVYLAILLPDEGLRPSTPLRFSAAYTMKSALFETSLVETDNGYVRNFIAKVVARSGMEGRSQAARGTYSSACQRDRAAELGVAIDKGCDFIASLANITVQPP